MLQLLLLLENVSDPESVTSLDTVFLSAFFFTTTSTKEVEHYAKTNSAFIFASFSYDVMRSSCLKQSCIWKTGSQTQTQKVTLFTIKPTQTVFDCLRHCYVYKIIIIIIGSANHPSLAVLRTGLRRAQLTISG